MNYGNILSCVSLGSNPAKVLATKSINNVNTGESMNIQEWKGISDENSVNTNILAFAIVTLYYFN